MNQKMLDEALEHIDNLTPEEFAQDCERLSDRANKLVRFLCRHSWRYSSVFPERGVWRRHCSKCGLEQTAFINVATATKRIPWKSNAKVNLNERSER